MAEQADVTESKKSTAVSGSASKQASKEKLKKPYYTVTFTQIKWITISLIVLLALNAFLSLKLFITAIQVRAHIGYYINLISSGDGEILPSLLAVPVFVFVILDAFVAFLLWKAFDKQVGGPWNKLMFFTILAGFVLLGVVFAVLIFVLTHAYSKHESLHDGITTAMLNYSSNPVLKSQLDMLQIEFQCCGSKLYDEWYSIKWSDTSVETEGGDPLDGNTPFSCCSIKSMFPCIHHNIEKTGTAYLYTPEFNLSISTRGCYEMLRSGKQAVGWMIIGYLFLYSLFQTVTLICFRLIQTAHGEQCMFTGHTKPYNMWIIGSGKSKVKVTASKSKSKTKTKKDDKKGGKATPPVPPVPPDLMD